MQASLGIWLKQLLLDSKLHMSLFPLLSTRGTRDIRATSMGGTYRFQHHSILCLSPCGAPSPTTNQGEALAIRDGASRWTGKQDTLAFAVWAGDCAHVMVCRDGVVLPAI